MLLEDLVFLGIFHSTISSKFKFKHLFFWLSSLCEKIKLLCYEICFQIRFWWSVQWSSSYVPPHSQNIHLPKTMGVKAFFVAGKWFKMNTLSISSQMQKSASLLEINSNKEREVSDTAFFIFDLFLLSHTRLYKFCRWIVFKNLLSPIQAPPVKVFATQFFIC